METFRLRNSCMVYERKTLKRLLAYLILADLHNHSPLLTMPQISVLINETAHVRF